MIPIGKSRLDGFLYNVSFTSMMGDQVGIVIATSIVITVMQRQPVNIPQKLGKLLQNVRVHWLILCKWFSIGVAISTIVEKI